MYNRPTSPNSAQEGVSQNSCTNGRCDSCWRVQFNTCVLKNLSDGERMVGEVLECTIDIEMLDIVECKGVCFIPDKIMPVLPTEKMPGTVKSYFLQ